MHELKMQDFKAYMYLFSYYPNICVLIIIEVSIQCYFKEFYLLSCNWTQFYLWYVKLLCFLKISN